MFLKKIVLKNFKSFQGKKELEFPVRVTAIVGPNGCGKSNILDAIRWILGEQSLKLLRVEKNTDLKIGQHGAAKNYGEPLEKTGFQKISESR